MNKYIIEFIGTFFLVLTIAISGGNPIAVGAILVAMIYMGGYISGGHFNPAVTLAVLLRKKIDRKPALIYMLVQLIGSALAALLVWSLSSSFYTPLAGQGINVQTVMILEFLYTFALAMVVLHVGTSDAIKDNYYYGVAIGLTVMAGVFTVGQITGGVFNPAIGLGTMIVGFQDFMDWNKALTFLGSYVVAPFAGAAIAAGVYRLTALAKK